MGAETPVKQRAKRPNKSEMEKRLADVFRLRLEGAGILNLLEYIREKELEPGSCWFLEPGEKPLSLRSIEHYIEQTNKQVREAFSKDRERILIEHRSRREWLYLKSVSVGDGENPDYRAALAILQDLAKIEGVYAGGQASDTNGDSGPVDKLTDEELQEIICDRG